MKRGKTNTDPSDKFKNLSLDKIEEQEKIDNTDQSLISAKLDLTKSYKSLFKNYDIQFGGVFYRDPVDESSDIHEYQPLGSVYSLKNKMSSIIAKGGGDAPEDWVGGYERIASDGRIITRVIPKPSDWAGYIVTAPWAHLFKTEFIRNNELKFLKNKIGEDVYFNVVALNCGANVEVINDSGYKWYYNTESVSNSVQNTFKDDVDVIYLMDSIVDAIGDNTYSPYLEYFFLRYVCWYMLFSTRGSRKLDIDKAYSKCFAWIGKNFPDYRKSKYIGIRMPKGENPKFHSFVFVFYLLERIHILKPVLKMFGK